MNFFYISVVSFRGVMLLPICIHPPTLAGTSAAVKAYLWSVDDATGRRVARETVLPNEETFSSEWQTVGMLEVVVCGLKDGEVLCRPRFDPDRYLETEYHDSEQCAVLQPDEAVAMGGLGWGASALNLLDKHAAWGQRFERLPFRDFTMAVPLP